MKLKSAFALLAAGTFLVACSDEVVNVNDEAKEKATITFRVVDTHTGAPIADAEVYSVDDEKSDATDELGLSVWKKQVLGSHLFQVSKEGYATILTGANLVEQGQGNVARVGDEIVNVEMKKTGVTAKGTVLYPNEDGDMVAAKGVTVYAFLGDQFVPSEVSATTDANGEYKFKDLPEGTAITISVGQETIGKYKYTVVGNVNIGSATNRAGDVLNVNVINMTKAASQVFAVSNNLSQISETTPVKLTFSSELVADSVTNSHWSVYAGGKQVLVTVSLTDKKTITIKPFSGKWTDNGHYSIEGYAFSQEGAATEYYATFDVGGKTSTTAPANVTNLKAETDDSSLYYTYVVLSWTAPKKVDDINEYQVYYKTNSKDMQDFVFYRSYDLYDIDENSISISLSNLSFGDATKITFVVLPVNRDGVPANIETAAKADYVIPLED